MTSRVDEIQRLIADIDNLLATSGKRLPKLLSSQAQEPREVLERIRSFLAQLGESEVKDSGSQNKPPGQQPLSPLLAKFIDQSHQKQSQEQQNPAVASSPQLNTEVSLLLQPLRAELAGLLQERANLVQEIRGLEQRRSQNYSLIQQLANQEQVIKEFLQVLMNRLVPSLRPYTTQTPTNSPTAPQISHQQNDEPIESAQEAFNGLSEQTELLTRLTRDLDQRLLSLDGTVNVVFAALQRNINTYHESLSQALARMHSQGLQGEQLIESFVNNLSQYLQQPSPSSPSSLFTGENQTPPVASTSTAFTPASGFVQPQTPALPTINDYLKDNDFTDDLDAVLKELGEETSLGSENPIPATPRTIQPEPFDEVDQLYASLFGSEHVIEPRAVVSPPVITEESSVFTTAAEFAPNTADIPSAPPRDEVEPVDEVIKLPDPWLEEPEPPHPQLQDRVDPVTTPTDSSSQSWELLFLDEQAAPDPALSKSSSVPLEAVAATDSSSTELTSDELAIADKIRSLADILPDFGQEQQFVALSPLPAPATTEAVIPEQEQEKALDNYIEASPEENLLSAADSLVNTIPDISLDEVQLQQLELDLANLDSMAGLNTQSQQELYTDNQNTAPFSPIDIPQIGHSSFPQPEVELDFSPTTEKKTEVTTPNKDSSVFSIDNNRNHPEDSLSLLESIWYLGIDLGTTGISAALLNRSTSVVYPIYWSAQNQAGTTSFEESFRLPAEVYLPKASVPHEEAENREAMEQTTAAFVAGEKVADNIGTANTPSPSAAGTKNNLYSAQLKPYLQVAIPYKSGQQKWEPVLQFNEFSAGPLIWVVRSLSKLLLTLKSDRHSTTQGLTATAVGIDETTFTSIISNIAGVICTCPVNWSEQYRFNVREALLTSKIVADAQQVFFIEEAIASLLAVLDSPNGETIQLRDSDGFRPVKTSEQPLIGNTLVLNIGATATEMTLVDVPENLQQLTHQDFMLHSFAYAGKGIEQDIICQLLLPPKSRQLRSQIEDDTTISNPWHWQPNIPSLDQMQWHSLGLEELELPRVGEPDITARIRLQQRLESSPLGQAVLDAALALKLILQHQESFTLDLADQRWVLQRRDLESQVLVPFVRRLNRELNKLLVARGIPTEAINQAILTGGVASIGTVNRWLRQKLPNAKIIQDSYLSENGAPNCSRVAYGLATLPLHPQILDIPRQQYTDYFLFTELLRLLPDRSLSFNEVIQLFEARGINTRTCQQRLLAFLEGELPPGLIPNSPDSTWLTQSSYENADYQAISATPLFDKQGSLTYRPNAQQLLLLVRYLDTIKASNQQSLDEPYTVNFALEVSG